MNEPEPCDLKLRIPVIGGDDIIIRPGERSNEEIMDLIEASRRKHHEET